MISGNIWSYTWLTSTTTSSTVSKMEYKNRIHNNYNDRKLIVNDNHIVWAFSRSPNPGPSTYKKVFDDLIKSGISPYNLMSMDQSVDFTNIPTVTPDELYGITQETVTRSSSTTLPDGTTKTSSSTTTVTTVSTIDYVPNPNYVSPYDFDTTCSLFGDIKVLKNLPVDVVSTNL